MKFAIVTDNSKQQSFYCNSGQFYSLFTNQNIGVIDDLYTNAYFSLPLVMDGYYLNLKDDIWPEENFDIILAAVECDHRYLDILKQVYPDAIIIGQMKEIWNHQINIRNYVIENTNGFVVPYSKLNFFKEYNLQTPRQYFTIPSPVNANYLRDKYYVSKEEKIFDYSNYWASGRASVNNKDILKNSNLETVFYRSENADQFIKHWSPCKYMINTDPSKGYGLMSIQCACMDTIMVGGNSDSQRILFPDLIGIDIDDLSNKLKKLTTDKDFYDHTLMYANKMFERYYSFNTVKIAIKDMYNKLKG
jgi:hypothetical protein